jgi:TRAP-type C4-dicarboxylate transport system permease small subunit
MAGSVARRLDRLEEWVTLFFLYVMCGAVLIQLVFRFLFNSPLFFPEEISRYSYVWITFFGLALATKHRDHIRMDLLLRALPDRGRAWVERAVEFVSCAILLVLAYLGLHFMEFSRMNISSALELPMNLVYVSFPVGCVLAVARSLRFLLAPRPGVR